MKINEKALTYFANCILPADKQGWLWKKGELNTSYQKRWCVLRGNLLFYFEKSLRTTIFILTTTYKDVNCDGFPSLFQRGDKDPIGVIVLERCTIELAEGGDSSYTFSIIFFGEGMRTYKFIADDEKELSDWMKNLSLSSYRYLKILVESLEKSANKESLREGSLLVPEPQSPILSRGLQKSVSTDDLLKVRGRLTKKPLSNSNSEKNLARLIDVDEKPLRISFRGINGVKAKSLYYPLKSSSDTLVRVEYGGKGKVKNQIFLTTDRSDLPTYPSASRSFPAMHEHFRLCIEECTSNLRGESLC